MEPQMRHEGSWLCPEPGDRERLLDMDVRLRRARALGMGFLAAALVVSAPWVGWGPVAVVVALAVAWFLLDRFVVSRSRKPEWPLAFGWLLSAGAISAGILMTGAATSPAKSWLLVPALTLPARYTKRALYVGVGIILVLLALTTAVAEPQEVIDRPELFFFPAGLILAAMSLVMALRSAEIQHRNESVLDQLTGMLNRKAFESRTVELEVQARITGQPIGLIVCDVDHFKRVNDTYGHAMGDAVLKDVAYRIRKELRAYDLAYRLGGEEFVVLLPGATMESAVELAERLRNAIEATPVESVSVTASFGVAVSADHSLDFEELFARADAALYRSKNTGRNRVSAAEQPAFAMLS